MSQATTAPNAPAARAAVHGPKTHARIPSLDGFRAVSILLVFVAHCGLDKIVPGGLGVTIFFFLSGFLITTLLRAEYEKNGRIHLGHFWLRRVLRILPPFYLVLFGAALVTLATLPPGNVTASTLTAQALHITNYWTIWHGYTGQAVGTGVYWSLAVEEHFYLVFPLLYIFMLTRGFSDRQQALTLLAICAVVMVWRCILISMFHVPTDRTYMATDTRIDSIAFGCVLAVYGSPLDSTPFNARRLAAVYLPLGCVVLLGTLFVRTELFREGFRYSIQGLALIPIFIAGIRLPDLAPFRLLNTRLAIFLGTLSYSFYLVHFSVILTIWNLFPAWHPILQAGVAFAISLFLSWAIYQLVERPAARLRKRLTDW